MTYEHQIKENLLKIENLCTGIRDSLHDIEVYNIKTKALLENMVRV